MKSHDKVVVVGGGVVGASVLYHLAKFGWTDTLLVECRVLTSGSSRHAAGNFHWSKANPNMAALQASYSAARPSMSASSPPESAACR